MEPDIAYNRGLQEAHRSTALKHIAGELIILLGEFREDFTKEGTFELSLYR